MAITETRQLPPKFIEDLGTDLGAQLVAQSGRPTVAPGIAGISQLAGESAADFAKRQQAAQEFDIRKQSIAGLAPTVAGQDRLQQQAQSLAEQGVGSYRQFLDQAQASTGPQAFQQFMSPYQQQVIDTSLAEFDRQAAMQEQRIRDSAVASGAFGGGREGVLQSEFRTGSDRNRSALQAGLLQQGFEQAQRAAQQNFANQMGIAGALPGLQRADVAQLGTLGAINQAQRQAELDAQREGVKMAALQPQEELDRFADITTGIMGGMRGTGTRMINTPSPSPLQSVLGIGSSLAGAYLGGLGRSGVNLFNT